MILIPAILFITRPKIHSIDKKGRATLEIQLLHSNTKGYTISKSYKKYTEDQLILVWKTTVHDHMYTLDRIVGSVNNPIHWETILPYRVRVPHSPKHHTPFIPNIVGKHGLRESNPYIHSNIPHSFLCVDSPGTVDREDGVWYKHPRSMGIFVVDIPSQFKWNHNQTGCLQHLSIMWNGQKQTAGHATRTYYLPSYRLPMIEPCMYRCVKDTNENLPILCYDIIQKKMFSSVIQPHHEVTLKSTDDSVASYPEWFRTSPLKDMSVAQQNVHLNLHWEDTLPKRSKFMMFSRNHPIHERYNPISSPVRNIGHLWNQCLWWDSHNPSIHWKQSWNHTLDEMVYSMVKSTLTAKYIRTHSHSLAFVRHIMKTETSVFDALVEYKLQPNSDGFIRICGEHLTIWCPADVLEGKKIGSRITIQCSIKKTPDPFRMIQIRKWNGKESSPTNTETESVS